MAKANVRQEGVPLGVVEIRMMLLPMCLDNDFNWPQTVTAAQGSEYQARMCKLLSGRALPGDVGCNKTSLFFRMEGGRKVSIHRHIKTNRLTLWWDCDSVSALLQ